MSDMPMPDTRAGAVSRDAVRRLASSWWLFLILGSGSCSGCSCCPTNVGSLLALAVFIGVTFVMTGITQVLAAGRVDSWKRLYLIGGVLSIIAGILALIWPGSTLLVLSVILAWFLVFKGIVDTVGALASIGRPCWWLGLLLGIVEFLLGIWAAGYPGKSLFVFVNLVGIYAILYGFTELFAAFELRGVDRRLDQVTERPAG